MHTEMNVPAHARAAVADQRHKKCMCQLNSTLALQWSGWSAAPSIHHYAGSPQLCCRLTTSVRWWPGPLQRQADAYVKLACFAPVDAAGSTYDTWPIAAKSKAPGSVSVSDHDGESSACYSMPLGGGAQMMGPFCLAAETLGKLARLCTPCSSSRRRAAGRSFKRGSSHSVLK